MSDEPQASEFLKAVVIGDIGPQKISMIKLIRQYSPLGLKEAKDLSERPGPFVLTICDEAIAEEFARQAESMGAACELRDPMESDQPAIDEYEFGFKPAGKSGCAGSAAFLLAVGTGMALAISRFL